MMCGSYDRREWWPAKRLETEAPEWSCKPCLETGYILVRVAWYDLYLDA